MMQFTRFTTVVLQPGMVGGGVVFLLFGLMGTCVALLQLLGFSARPMVGWYSEGSIAIGISEGVVRGNGSIEGRWREVGI